METYELSVQWRSEQMKGAKLCQGFLWGVVIFRHLKAIKIISPFYFYH